MSNHNEGDIARIQRDIEHTRSQLDETLTAIESRLAPSQLLEDGMDYLRHHGGREYLANLNASVKREPLPLALVGVGLAWMMMSNSRQHSHGNGAVASHGSEPSVDVHHAAAHVRNQATAASAKVSELASQATHKVADLAHGVRDSARHASDTVREGAQRVRGGYDYLVNEQPLALGAIGFALGVILAAAAPRSNAEDHLLGDSSDRLKDDIGQRGREQADRLTSAASAVVENTRATLAPAPSPTPTPTASSSNAPQPQFDPPALGIGRPHPAPDAQP